MNISEQWADALDPIVRVAFQEGFSRRNALAPQLFNVQTSSRVDEQLSGIGAIGLEAWETYEASGVAGQADFDQAHKVTLTHSEKVMEVRIERKLVEDSMWNQIKSPVFGIGDSANVKREVDGASVFNNSTSGSFLGGDSVALLSNSHPLSPAKTGSTQDNLLALALTKDNLSTARQTMQSFTDDNTELVAATPNLLLVPPELEDAALEIALSTHDPDSANNTINTQHGRYEVAAWHYLTDSNRWYLIDSHLMNQSLHWFNRVPLGILPKVEDKTLAATWIARMRYSFGWSDWRWIIGSEVS